MNVSYITINGDSIAIYTNSSKSNNAIVFLHGNSLNSLTFLNQFENEDLDQYKLVAIDFPGHGKSEKPSNPAKNYSATGLIEVVKSIINQLNLESIILVGHSFGGHIAIETSEEINCLKGLVIFGTPPISLPPDLEKMYLPNEALNYAFKGDLSDEEIQILASSYTNQENNLSQYIKETDTNARASIGAAIGKGNYKDEPNICRKINIPLAIFHGEDDVLINQDYFSELDLPTLWQGAVCVIKNSGHSPQMEEPYRFNTLLKEFTIFCFNE